MFQKQARNIIYQSISEKGFLATSLQKDNYQRVWARDSMMTGIIGVFEKDETIIESLKTSVLNLVKHQAETGQIPSNISIDAKVSYGGLVGRVDATTWWIIGTCAYLKHSKDEVLKSELKSKIEKALFALKTWEFNNRGLIYTPLGGNWADEYLVSGYTLYDNILRYWAVKSVAEIYQNVEMISKAKIIKTQIENNFSKNKLNENTGNYHPTAFAKAPKLDYYYMSFSANGYSCRFDMAGNALAILLDFEFDLNKFEGFLHQLNQEFNHWMLPVFYPIVHENDKDWDLLENNYNFSFKNMPYHFHNGGAWPVFLGWLCYALKSKNKNKIALKIQENYEELLFKNEFLFHEYYATDTLKAMGTEKLCFSALGYLLMKLEK